MNSARPTSLTWIAILLVVIALANAVSPFLNTLRIGAPGQNLPNGVQPEQIPQGGNVQPGQGDGNFQPGQGNGNFQGNRNFQGRGGGLGLFGLLGTARNLGINVQIISYISIGFTILGVLLTLLAAFGVGKQKRWGLNLALALALFFVIGALPGLFLGGGRAFGVANVLGILRSILHYVKPLAALPILVMSILPSTRDFTS